jgi:chromosome segregation ATPase
MKTGAKRARLDSPVSAAAVLDRRVVIVKSDQARSRIADLSSFIQGIEEERDAALAKVCDLETTVSELEADNERIPQLENDVSYWRTDREEQKTAKDNFEMELRRAKEDLQRLNAVIASNTRDIEANKKVHKNKDQQIEKLNTDNMRLRSEMAASLSEHKDTLADLNFRLQEKNVNCQQMTEALNAAIQESRKAQSQLTETDRIKAENERIEEENENLKLDLSDKDQANERLERELHEKNTIFGAEKLDNIRLTENMRRLEVLFMDAYKLSAEGTGYLLGSGRMLSLHSIARAW